MIKGNLWAKFKSLTNPDPKQIATVTSVRSDGYTVQFDSGNIGDVGKTGSYSVNDRVFVRANEITGLAPALNYFEFEV